MLIKIFKHINNSTPINRDSNVQTFFQPLLRCLHYLGFLDLPAVDKSVDSAAQQKPTGIVFRQCCRWVYIVLMWTWTAVLSINAFYMGISANRWVDWTNKAAEHGNMVISLLEESPYAFMTIRNAAILTIFVYDSDKLLAGIESCEKIRKRLNCINLNNTEKVTFQHQQHRPFMYIIPLFVIIILFEIFAWNAWFGTSGVDLIWDFYPFPFSLTQLQYAYFWWAFTTIPFFLSQLALCFPVMFAYILREYICCINKELRLLSAEAIAVEKCRDDMDYSQMDEFGHRVMQLRTEHFHVVELMLELDKMVNGMVLIEFVCDVVVLFGFTGLLVDSKDADPPIETILWTLYIAVSLMWLLFLLTFFNYPLITLSEEAEKTSQLVHGVTFSSGFLFKKKFKDLRMFLSETKRNEISFTGLHFFHINRHYYVSILALTSSYLIVITEILDRFYSAGDLKKTIVLLTQFVSNNSKIEIHHDHND